MSETDDLEEPAEDEHVEPTVDELMARAVSSSRFVEEATKPL